MYFSRLALRQLSWQHLPKFEQLFLQDLQQFRVEIDYSKSRGILQLYLATSFILLSCPASAITPRLKTKKIAMKRSMRPIILLIASDFAAPNVSSYLYS